MKIRNNKIKLTVLIVNFNNARFLVRSIESVLNQSCKLKKEIIVIDDNSTDNSIEILKKFKNKIKIIKNKKKTTKGSYNQMNCYYRGFLKSKGDYLFFLDSDDYFKKDKIKLVINEFSKRKNLKVLFDLPIWKYKNKIIKKKFKQKKFIISNWPRFSPQSCISVEKKFAEEFFNHINVKKFDKIWFDFRIACYVFLKVGNLPILMRHLTYYRQLANSASKEFKTFSKNWWLRRKQAHDFVFYIERKLNVNNKFTLDKLLTKLVNFFLNE